ncbi:hypothetical protein GCM10022250_37990 [Flavobacterium chungbukense]|uniref:Uncharacterized protein n=1 Tax=Flavobacterium chungbukense TaxID=877464 RepID=A0ABP7YNH6_9FLAO
MLFTMMMVLNLLFIKKLKIINKNKAKHKLIFFLINIITIAVITFFYIKFQFTILKKYFEIDESTNGGIIITLMAIILLNSLLNIFIIKIYIKKISKSSEIELIGKE